MSSEFLTTLIEATTDETSHESALIDTTAFPTLGINVRPQLRKQKIESEEAIATLSVTSLTTSGIGVVCSLVAEIDGVDHVLSGGAFTIRTTAGVQKLNLGFCPQHVKVVCVATDTTVYVASVHITRF